MEFITKIVKIITGNQTEVSDNNSTDVVNETSEVSNNLTDVSNDTIHVPNNSADEESTVSNIPVEPNSNEEPVESSGLENLQEVLSKIQLDESVPTQPKLPNAQNSNFKLISPIFFTGVAQLLKSRQIPQPIEKLNVPLSREIFARVLKEIKDVNDDFFNLRTVIVLDPDRDVNTFYFTMIPNDGLYCHLPLIGRIIIPSAYPVEPPVFHLLTKTNRFNVDIYSYHAFSFNKSESSMCFDILKRKSNYGDLSAWKESYTISAVISALMQSIVSFTVPQMHGGEQQEFVTMESLQLGYTNVQETIKTYSNYIGDIPEIPANLAVEIPAEQLDFPKTIKVESPNAKSFEKIFKSKGFYIGENLSYTCGFDLSKLTPNYVFSVVLTTDPDDLTGKKPGTILFRNGVTGSAAIKPNKPNAKTKWYYHGKPLNQSNLKLTVTITNREFVMGYKDITTKDKWVVHGDYPIAYLDNTTSGDIKNKMFYLVLYFKRKSGSNNLSIDNIYPQNGLVSKAH